MPSEQNTYRPHSLIDYTPRALPDANVLEDRVNRLTQWAVDYIVAGVKALKAADRPIFTRPVSHKELLAQLLSAPPGFWEQLQQIDPETATAFVATVLKARDKGETPRIGPQFDVAEQLALQQQAKQEAEDEQQQQSRPLETRAVRFALKPSNV